MEMVHLVSIRQQIPLLEELARIDEEIRRVEEDLGAQKAGLDSLRSDVQSLEKKLGADRESVSTMERTRNELMTEVRQMNSQIEKAREKQARSRNERETLAAQREFEELRKLVRDREIEIEKLSSLAEKARDSVTQAETKKSEIEAQLAGTVEGATQSVENRQRERGDLAQRREVAVKALPPVLYRRYESIRQRRPRAIASTSDGTCKGCHIAVPPMMFQKMLRQEEFEQCPNCRRILYYVPPPERAEAEGSR
jgi:predicted  nucleic acid-binding Zn-ribbon protein